jgi:signal transduction histidine kinase
MRKSGLILLIVIQILALFIFENVYALFQRLEVKEREQIMGEAERMGELLVRRHGPDIGRMQKERYFERITTAPPGSVPSEETRVSESTQSCTVRFPLPDGRTAEFHKTIRSLQLRSIRNLKKIFSGMSIVLGIFLLITGIFLILAFRKPKEEKTQDGVNLTPFQNYLVELKSVQSELEDLITEQNRTSLKKEELNKSIVNNLHLAVIFLNLSGKIEIFNPSAQSMFSRTYVFTQNNDLHAVLKDFPEIVPFVTEGGRKSGEIESAQRTFFADMVPVPNSGRLVLIRDITDDKKKERIQQINSSLLILGEISASLAHEIKNSLGVIYGYAKGLGGDARKTRKIIDEINYLTAMMENFLSFSKPVERIQLSRMDLKPILARITEANQMNLRLPEEEILWQSDPVLLNVIFSNLILNSKQAGADSIRIERSSEGEILIGDNGPGIEAKIGQRIWLPFFSTKQNGTGMGLPIVKKMVNALNGDIELLPDRRPGTWFKITFFP